MRRKVHFFLNNNDKTKKEEVNEMFGFKSKHHKGQLKELKNLEKHLFNVVTSLKFRKLNDDFQKKKLILDISDIKSSPNVFIFADKTNIIY